MNILSFILPITLYRNRSKLNSLIEVKEVAGMRRLYMDGYPQSQNTYRRDWKTVLTKAGLDKLQGEPNILLLGLGGGDVIKLLQRSRVSTRITAIELDPVVVAVARDYFGIKETSQLKIIVMDAAKYLRDNRVKYDWVVVDLYSGDDIPQFVSTDVFLQNVARSLNPQGKAIINYASHDFTQANFAVFEQKLRNIFRRVERIKTWGHTYYLVERPI